MSTPNDITALPYPHSVLKHVKRLPPEVVRWLLELRDHPQTSDAVTALHVYDENFTAVVMPLSAWRRLKEPVAVAHHKRAAGGLLTEGNRTDG